MRHAFLDAQHEPHFDDFFVYRTAGTSALAHRTAYDVGGHYQFNYPPFAALVYAHTFASVEAVVATDWWYRITLAGFVLLALWASLRLLPKYGLCVQLHHQLLLAAMQVLTFGIALRDESKLGQTTLIPAAVFVCLCELSWVREKVTSKRSLVLLDIAIGLIAAFGIEMKIYLVLLMGVFLVRKQWLVLATAAFAHVFIYSGAFMVAAHGLEFALAEHSRWLASASRYTTDHALTDFYNVSLASNLTKHFGQRAASIANAGATLMVFAAQFYLRKRPFAYVGAFTLFAITLVNPVVWPYWLLIGIFYFTWVVGNALASRLEPVALVGAGLYAAATQVQNTQYVSRGWLTAAALAFLVSTFALVPMMPKPRTPEI